MIASSRSDRTLRHSLGVPWRHKGKMLLFFALVMGAAAGLTFGFPKVYRSEGKLLLRLGRENMSLDPTATLGTTPLLVQQSRENEMNSAIEILRSRVLVERVVDQIGPAVILGRSEWKPGVHPEIIPVASTAKPDVDGEPGADRPLSEAQDREAAVRCFMSSLDVEAARKSNVVQITYDALSPGLANEVVNRLVDDFLDEHVRLNRTPGAQEFLAQQTDSIRQRLKTKEDELRNLKDQTGLADAEGRRKIIITRIGRLEDELLQASASLASSEAEVSELREKLESVPASSVREQTVGYPNEAADGMRQQLYTLQIREQELAAKVTNDHPQLQQVRKQIAEAQAVLDREKPQRIQTTTAVSKPHEEIKIQLLRQEPVLAALAAKTDRLQEQLSSERATLQKLNDDELRVARLNREVLLEEANYRKYADSLEQARIDRAMAEGGKSNISIVQPATYDLKPIKPRVAMNMALALVVSIVGGLGLAFLAESLDDPLLRPAESLDRPRDVPAVTTLPRFKPRPKSSDEPAEVRP